MKTLITTLFILFIFSNCAHVNDGPIQCNDVKLPSETGVYANLQPKLFKDTDVIFAALDIVYKGLLDKGYEIRQLNELKIYTVDQLIPCAPELSNSADCWGITYFDYTGDRIEVYVMTGDVFDIYNGSLIHELLHALLKESSQSHNQPGVWRKSTEQQIDSLEYRLTQQFIDLFADNK